MSFAELGLHPSLLRGVVDAGYTAPTPIQRIAIPPAAAGRDLLACAMTGSGKTAAFALPLLHRLLDAEGRAPKAGKPRALVLTPTRELAAQVHGEFQRFGKPAGITTGIVFGGVGIQPQVDAFRRGMHILVATPGRLLDHLGQGTASLHDVEILVLDEADRMLDMGFLPDVRRVLRQIPNRRQALLFSATMPPPIGVLAKELLRDPATVDVERRSKPATGIEQAVWPVKEELKPALLVQLLRSGILQQALVFTRTKHRANRLAEWLVKHGVKAERIHGNRSQNQRTQALAGFKNGAYEVLVATDIAARGIDVEALEHVVNFDVPHLPEDYIHRVGRTGRADAVGEAYTFVSPGEEEQDLRAIEKAIGRQLPRRKLEGFDYAARPDERFEVPIAERIAEIRRRKAEDRARARAKTDAKAQRASAEEARETRRPGTRQAAAKPARGPAPSSDRRRDSQGRPSGESSGGAARGGGGAAGSGRRGGRGGRGPGRSAGSNPYRGS